MCHDQIFLAMLLHAKHDHENTLDISGVAEASNVKQITQRERQSVLSNTLQWLSLRVRVWHSLNMPCLGRSGVFKQMHERWGSCSKMHYRDGEVERVQHFQTHYAGAPMACFNRVLMEGGERGGSREFLFYFGKVCVLCLPVECWRSFDISSTWIYKLSRVIQHSWRFIGTHIDMDAQVPNWNAHSGLFFLQMLGVQ